VCEVGWVNGLAALRSLGRAGLRVLAVDHRPWALGLRSRYAEPVIAPDPLDDEDGFLARLAELGRTLDEPVPVFPTHDEHLNAIARKADSLGNAFRYPFPSWDVLERVQEKRHQLDKAVEVGLGVPRTLHPRSVAEARAAGEELGYPVFVKPSKPQLFKQRYGRQAYRCETWPELEEAYGRMEPYEPMVQEWIPGGDDELYTVGSYIASDGAPLGLFCGRKLRQTLPWMGSCRVGEAVWVDRVIEDGLRLLRALGYHGISQVEVKRDPRDGVFKLIEVNPRLWQWHGLAAACGVDLPLIAWRDLTGDRPEPARMVHEGKRWAISFMAGQGTALQRPPYVDGVFALDDPRPALTQARRYAMRGAARAGVRLPAKRPAAGPRPQATRPR
jgi:D-aspartate ligase